MLCIPLPPDGKIPRCQTCGQNYANEGIIPAPGQTNTNVGSFQWVPSCKCPDLPISPKIIGNYFAYSGAVNLG
jgi:hypothetical protein